MAVPKVDGQFIAEAIKYIDENGVPWHNTSTKYELVWENGNTYPPKYVIAVANHLQNGAEIDVSGYNAVEAKNYLTAKGYEIQIKQTKYEITITSDSVTSTDDSFTMDNISAGDVFKPLDENGICLPLFCASVQRQPKSKAFGLEFVNRTVLNKNEYDLW